MNRRTFLRRLSRSVLSIPILSTLNFSQPTEKNKAFVLQNFTFDNEIINCGLDDVLETRLVLSHDHSVLEHMMSPDAHTHTFPEWNDK